MMAVVNQTIRWSNQSRSSNAKNVALFLFHIMKVLARREHVFTFLSFSKKILF